MTTSDSSRTLSFVNPYRSLDLKVLTHSLRIVNTSQYDRLWFGATLDADYLQQLTYLAGAGVSAPIGISVDVTPVQHPQTAAVRAISASQLTKQSLVAGFGSGPAVSQHALLGAPYRRPLAMMREYLEIVRRTLDADPEGMAGEYFSMPGGRRFAGDHQVLLGAGVLRTGMAEAAGEFADRALTWLTPPAYLQDVLAPAVVRGAVRRDRDPGDVRVVTMLGAAVNRPGRDPVPIVVEAGGRHTTYPHYVATLQAAGVPVRQTDDPTANVDTLLTHDVFVYGSPEVIADAVRAYWYVGVDEVVLNLNGVYACHGLSGYANDLLEIQRALAATPAFRDGQSSAAPYSAATA